MEKLFLGLLNNAISAGWLILAVLALRLLLHRAPKNARCALWALVGLRLALPVRLRSVLSLVPSAQPVPSAIATAAAPAIDSGIPAVNSVVNPVLAENLAPVVGNSVNPLQVWLSVAAWVWLAGLALLLGYALVSYLRLRRRVADSVPEADGVRLSEQIDSPFVLGVLRPVIYLPFGLSPADREPVLAHERGHIARRDHWWKPLGFLLLSVFWFQPLCWLAYLLFCRDIELACDERVIRALDLEAKKAYSRALLNCSAAPRALSACPVAFGETGVKSRVKSVLRYKKPSFYLVLLAAVLCIAAAVCFLTDPVEARAALEEFNAAEYNFVQDLIAEHNRGLGYQVLSRAEYVEQYGDDLVAPAVIPDNFQYLDRVYVWPEDHFPAVKQVWYDAAGKQAVFVIQQNEFQDDGLPTNAFNGYSSGLWRANLPWARYYADDFLDLGDRWVTLQYYAADYAGYGTRELPMLQEGSRLTPNVYYGPAGALSEEAAAEALAGQQFLDSVWAYEEVGSLYTPMSYADFYSRYGEALIGLPSLPERFQNTGFVYVWSLDDSSVRAKQIWIDPVAMEMVCANQLRLPGRNVTSSSGYVHLNRDHLSAFPYSSYPWLVYRYEYRCRLGADVDAQVHWYGPEDLGETACAAMLNDAALSQVQAVQPAPDGQRYVLHVGESIELDEAFGHSGETPGWLGYDENERALFAINDWESGLPVLTALAPTEEGIPLAITAQYGAQETHIYIEILPAEPSIQVFFFATEITDSFVMHLDDMPVLLTAAVGGEPVTALWTASADGSLSLTETVEGCFVGPGYTTSPAGGATLTVSYGDLTKALTVYVVD